MNGGRRDGDSGFRQLLAGGIIGASVLGLAAISIVAIQLGGDDRARTTQLVFSSLLPLFGTWVGTVLAFYFARENLAAATESTLRITAAAANPQASVLQAMLPRARITSHDLASGAKADDVALKDLLDKMSAARVQRIPILNSGGDVAYVVHDSTINAYAAEVKKDPSDAAAFTDKVSDLLAIDRYAKAIKAIGTVGTGAVLADARAAMRTVDGCNDVFVTTNGQRNDPMVGWLTNTDLAGLS
jgi:hypothetical protein